MLGELGLLLVSGLLLSVLFAFALAAGSGASLGSQLLPPDVADLARTAMPGARIVDATYDGRRGFVLSLRDPFGLSRRLLILRDATRGWLYDPTGSWERIRGFRMDGAAPLGRRPGGNGPTAAPGTREAVARALEQRGLQERTEGEYDALLRWGTFPAHRGELECFVLELDDATTREPLWRALARAAENTTTSEPAELQPILEELLAHYPPPADGGPERDEP